MLPSGVKQSDISDCGPATIVSIAKSFDLRISITQVRQSVGTTKSGTTALAMIHGLTRLGMTAKAVKGPSDALKTVHLPAIAHCKLESGLMHYVVLAAWNAKQATVMDPAIGRVEKWPHEKFKSIWTGVLILVAPDENFKTGNLTASPWRRLWELLNPNSALLLQAFIGVVISTILGLGMSIYVQKLIDNVIPETNRQLLNLLGVTMLVILSVKLLLGVFQSLLSVRLAQRIDASLILAYYRRLMHLPQHFFDTMRVGEITSRVADATKIRNFLNSTLLNLMLNPLIVVFALTAMFFYSWKLALFSLVLVPCNAAIYWVVNWFNRTYQRRIMERTADFDAQLVESLNAQQTIRRFGLEDYSKLRTESRLVQLLRTVWRMSLGAIGSNTAGTLVTQAYMIVLLWIGGSLALDAVLTPGELMSCYTLASYLTGPITSLIGMNASIQDALVATDRLFDIMDLEIEKDQGTIALSSDTSINGVRFENITFSHSGRASTLSDISFDAPSGKITALVGESGCGKSTLLSLLQRLYLPASGRIFVGEHDIQYYTIASLRKAISVVPQQTILLSGTVIENIVPGNFEPDMQRILQICRDVGILESIEKLPQGFLTYLNENATNLSGGQRQRLALARALYRDSPILLLDEPSSALDAHSEKNLMQLLVKLRDEGKIIILAAHSERLLDIANRVVTIASGKIISIVGNNKAPPASQDASHAASKENRDLFHVAATAQANL